MANTSNLNLEIIDLTSTPNKTMQDLKESIDSNFQIIDGAFTKHEYTNVTASNWESDSTYTDYIYKCVLTCSGITSSSFVEVVFGVNEATSGNYAPVCLSGTNSVTIYSKVNATIIIPVIREV